MIKAHKQDRELDIMEESLTFGERNTGTTCATRSREASYMIGGAAHLMFERVRLDVARRESHAGVALESL